jgi:hypothetical protein
MKKEHIYQDYLRIKEMHAPLKTKIAFLTYLFSNQPNPWRVIGVTKDALIVFEKYNFKKVSRMGINRSHIIARRDTYRDLLEKNFKSLEEWWDYYFTRDMTILSTSSENMSSRFSEIIPIDVDLELFKTQGFAWKHGKSEIDCLKELFNKYF